jgi:GT2 family glycosyltransferase
MRKSAKETLLSRSPKVSVILLNRNRLKDTTNCLRSLLKTNYLNFELIMVDNASNDCSVKYIAEHFPIVKIIQNKENLGYAGGNNTGLRSLDGESKYVVLVQEDMKFDPNWLKELVRVAEGDPTIGVCQPKILQFFDPKKFEYNGACGGFLDLYGYPCLRGRVMDYTEEDDGQHNSIIETFWAGGCAIFIRKDVLKETGLLDEMFFIHFEEIDLCWRFRLCGYKIVCVPSSIVYHKGAGGATKISTKMLFLKYRNNVFMLVKNYSLLNLLKRLPIRITIDASSVAKNGPTPIKAYLSILRNFRKLWQNRAYVQAHVRRVSDDEIAKMMIKKPVPLMYLKGYKTFKQFKTVW